MAVDFGPMQEACRETFGETVSYTPAGGEATSVTGVFNLRSQELSAEGVVINALRPNLGIKTDDLEDEPAQGDTVSVRGVTYKVAEVEDDGEGWTVLYLHRAS